MWICKNCQNQNEENFRFCWSCGESKSASRKTVRGNTTELSFPKKKVEKEIPQVKQIKIETKKPEEKKKIEKETKDTPKKEKPLDVKVKTKEVPEFESEISEVTTQKPPEKSLEENLKSKEPKKSYEPEIFSSFSPESSKSEKALENSVKTNWQKDIFTIAVRLLGLYFLYLFIAAMPEIISFIYASINAGIEAEQFVLLYLLSIVTSLLKYFFYLFVGIYLIANGKIVLRLLPEY